MSPENLLANIPLFSSLTHQQREDLSRTATTRKYPREALIFQEGDPADALYLVEEGKVKVQLADTEGNDVIISVLGPGEHFGEMALIDAEPRSTRITTMVPTTLRVIGKDAFKKWLSGDPDVSIRLMQELSRRLRRANRTIGSLAMLDVAGRVARVLLESAEKIDGQLVIEEPPTQKDIASMVGASREMVNRTMKQLTEDGRVRMDGKRIVITEELEQPL